MGCQKATCCWWIGTSRFPSLGSVSSAMKWGVGGGGAAAHHVKPSLSPQILPLVINSNYRVPVTVLGTLRE